MYVDDMTLDARRQIKMGDSQKKTTDLLFVEDKRRQSILKRNGNEESVVDSHLSHY